MIKTNYYYKFVYILRCWLVIAPLAEWLRRKRGLVTFQLRRRGLLKLACLQAGGMYHEKLPVYFLFYRELLLVIEEFISF